MKWSKKIATVFYKHRDKSIEMDPRPRTEFSKFIDELTNTWEFEDEDHVTEFMSGDTDAPTFFDYADKFNVELVEPKTNIIMTLKPEEELTASDTTPHHVHDIQGKIVQAVEKAHRVSDTFQMESLRKLIRSHVQKLF